MDFAEDMNSAYTTWLMGKIAELEDISMKPASELFPGLDFKEAEATRKARMDALKFITGKMAPVLSKRFAKANKMEIEVEAVLPVTYNVINYAQPKCIDVKGADNEPNNH